MRVKKSGTKSADIQHLLMARRVSTLKTTQLRRSSALFVTISLCLFLTLTPSPVLLAQGQPLNQYNITLYAHSAPENSLIMNASIPEGPPRCDSVNNTITFTLNPPIGTRLDINGSVITVVDLHATSYLSGTLITHLWDKQGTGQRVLIPSTNLTTPITLTNRSQVVPIGVGPIEYEFKQGSMIQLDVLVLSSSPKTTPYLCWDGSPQKTFIPTSVRLTVVDPTRATIDFVPKQKDFKQIIRCDNPPCPCSVSANVTDAFGISRLSVSATLTGPNRTLVIRPSQSSTYSQLYTYNATLGLGQWNMTVRTLDTSGNSDSFNDGIWITPYIPVQVNVVDQSGDTLANATVRISFRGSSVSNLTSPSGSVNFQLPSYQIVGPLNLTVAWQNVTIGPQPLNESSFTVRLPVYNFQMKTMLYGAIPLPNAKVSLLEGVTTIAKTTTGWDGIARFSKIPGGNYTVSVEYLAYQNETTLSVNPTVSDKTVTVNLPVPPYFSYIALSTIILVAATSAIFLIRRRSLLYPYDFTYLDGLTSGGIPDSSFTVIVGNAGSGKTVFLESLAAKHLTKGQGCVYIANSEYPAEIRTHMLTLGIAESLVNSGKLLFIDSYSAISGIESAEEFHVSSHTDLTSLSVEVTKCLERLGSQSDVYIDSATTMLNSLRGDYLLTFLQSIAGKVKASGGKLVLTIGTGIEKTDMVKFEETADCVLETQLQESKGGQKRRFRVKKLRGKPYIDRWTLFRIESGKGVVFLARAIKPAPRSAPVGEQAKSEEVQSNP